MYVLTYMESMVAEGAGGVLFELGGNIVETFSWRLGIESNNRDEILSLCMRTKVLIKKNIFDTIILGDSYIAIRSAKFRYALHNTSLTRIN